MPGSSFEEVRDELRAWREDNSRRSDEVLERWGDVLKDRASSLGDERWMVEEQVLVAALDCGRPEVAEECLEALRAQFPGSLRVARLQAMAMEAQGHTDEALTIYSRILREDETNSAARKRKVALLRSQRRYGEAVKELTDYLNKFMSDAEAWQELCDLYLKTGELSRAAFCMEELLLHQPHSALHYTRYAEIRYTQGGADNLEAAKAYFAHACRLSPGCVRALYGLRAACEGLMAAKGAAQRKKGAERLAEWAGQEIRKRYAEQEDSEVASAVLRLSLADRA